MNQLTEQQRYTIASMYSTGTTQKEIAKTIGKCKILINSKLKRNSDGRDGTYNSELAQRKSEERHRKKPKKIRLTASVKAHIKCKLELHYSPEQIFGRSKLEGVLCVSTGAIYQYIG